jgi:hypothetical protein
VSARSNGETVTSSSSHNATTESLHGRSGIQLALRISKEDADALSVVDPSDRFGE